MIQKRRDKSYVNNKGIPKKPISSSFN